MDEVKLHEIAVAYAQVKLQQFQSEYKESCDSEEIYQFAKAYRFALNNFENELEKID